MTKGLAHVISGPPATRLTRGQLLFHGLFQSFMYMLVPFGALLMTPWLRKRKEPEDTSTGEPVERADKECSK